MQIARIQGSFTWNKLNTIKIHGMRGHFRMGVIYKESQGENRIRPNFQRWVNMTGRGILNTGNAGSRSRKVGKSGAYS